MDEVFNVIHQMQDHLEEGRISKREKNLFSHLFSLISTFFHLFSLFSDFYKLYPQLI